jgi:hypothetical protein
VRIFIYPFTVTLHHSSLKRHQTCLKKIPQKHIILNTLGMCGGTKGDGGGTGDTGKSVY